MDPEVTSNGSSGNINISRSSKEASMIYLWIFTVLGFSSGKFWCRKCHLKECPATTYQNWYFNCVDTTRKTHTHTHTLTHNWHPSLLCCHQLRFNYQVVQGVRPKFPSARVGNISVSPYPASLRKITKACWQPDRSSRPSAAEVQKWLTSCLGRFHILEEIGQRNSDQPSSASVDDNSVEQMTVPDNKTAVLVYLMSDWFSSQNGSGTSSGSNRS